MTNRMSPLGLVVYLLVLFTLVLVSCQVSVTPTQVSKNDDIQDVRVRIAQPTTRIAKVEQFPLPNCGGTDKLSQSLGSYASVTKSASLGAKASTSAGGEAGIPATVKLKLEIQVELAYQKAYESANSRVDSITISAAAGSHVVYAIVWEEQIFSSIVEYASDGNVYEAPYTYQLTVPKIDKSYKIECLAGNSNPPTLFPTRVQQPTLTPSHFQFVSLQNIGKRESGNLGLEAGVRHLAGVDFQIGWLATTQSESDPNNPTVLTVNVQPPIANRTRIHILLQASWGNIQPTEFGAILIFFENGNSIREPLRIGYNVRDWSYIDIPPTGPNTKQAHEGPTWDGSGRGVVDVLTITIPNELRSAAITRIEIRDESNEKLNSPNPGLYIWAITVE